MRADSQADAEDQAAAFEQAARDHARSRAAIGTRYLYEADLDHWLEHCARLGVNPAVPTLAAATAFRDELRGRCAPQTVRRVLAALSSMYEAALGHEQPRATWNPFKRLPRPPADLYAKTEAVSEEDAQKILAAAVDNRRDSAILYLLYSTGLRRESVALLRRDRVFRRDGMLIARVIVKGEKEREVEIPDAAAAALTEWIARSPEGKYVFPARGGRGPLTPPAVNKIVKRWAERAGVGHVHPHQFRAAFATHGLDVMALHEVQAAMHHLDPNTTLRYDRRIRGKGVTSAVAKHRAKLKGEE